MYAVISVKQWVYWDVYGTQKNQSKYVYAYKKINKYVLKNS